MRLLALNLIVLAAGSVPVAVAAQSCEALSSLKLPDTTFTATAVAAGDFSPPQGQALHNLAAFCRVSGVI
jgi:hypothetical protein